MDKELYKAFARISTICVAQLGDIPKNDLILVGRRLESEPGELEQKFPDLFIQEVDKQGEDKPETDESNDLSDYENKEEGEEENKEEEDKVD